MSERTHHGGNKVICFLNGGNDDKAGRTCQYDESSLPDVIQRLTSRIVDVEKLQRKLECMIEEREGTDTIEVLRDQLDSISDRVFCTEQHLRQTEERQDEAISKAGLTFQKHACEVEQERQNLLCVINQVNQNFQYLSSEIAQYSMTIATLGQNVDQLQNSAEKNSDDVNDINVTMTAFSKNLSYLEGCIQEQHQQTSEFKGLEQMVEHQEEQINTLLTSIQSTQDAVGRMTSHSAFYEADARHQALQDMLSESRSQHAELANQFYEMQDQVSHLLNEVSWDCQMPTKQPEFGTREPLMVAAHTVSQDERGEAVCAEDYNDYRSMQPQYPRGPITKLVQDSPPLSIDDCHWPCYEPSQLVDSINDIGVTIPCASQSADMAAALANCGFDVVSDSPIGGKELLYRKQSRNRTYTDGYYSGPQPNSRCLGLSEVPAVDSRKTRATMSAQPLNELQDVQTVWMDAQVKKAHAEWVATPEPSAVPVSALSMH